MKHVAIALGLVVIALMCFTPIEAFAQATSVAIKVEAMSPHRLVEIGQPDPGDHSYISSGLKVVGVGSFVWLSGWDISDGATYAPGTAYNWVFTGQPGGSTAAFDNAAGSLVKFQTDVAGVYN
ncbi:MAG: hypothetical protein IH628_04495, partial [Proteobacteria bacterium]|nr:hypothetical protein [Pseudomonadota bacterium]